MSGANPQLSLTQDSTGAVTSFVCGSCDFVDRALDPKHKGRSTKSHEIDGTKPSDSKLKMTFEEKPLNFEN